MSGVIKGKGNGNWGRVTINRDGSLLLEKVTLSDIKITNCDLHAESGEYARFLCKLDSRLGRHLLQHE